MKTIIRSIAIASTLALMSGCATTKYQCPAPNGVTCMSASGVYELTNAPGKAGMAAASGVTMKKGASARGGAHEEVKPAADINQVVTPLPKPGDVIPIREQSRVMRIWIAPWVDTGGNLNMASRVYTEIEPKRWSVGEEVSPVPTNFFPLQVEQFKASPESVGSSSAVTPGASAVVPGTDGRNP